MKPSTPGPDHALERPPAKAARNKTPFAGPPRQFTYLSVGGGTVVPLSGEPPMKGLTAGPMGRVGIGFQSTRWLAMDLVFFASHHREEWSPGVRNAAGLIGMTLDFRLRPWPLHAAWLRRVQPHLLLGLGGFGLLYRKLNYDGSREPGAGGGFLFRVGLGCDVWLTRALALQLNVSYQGLVVTEYVCDHPLCTLEGTSTRLRGSLALGLSLLIRL